MSSVCDLFAEMLRMVEGPKAPAGMMMVATCALEFSKIVIVAVDGLDRVL